VAELAPGKAVTVKYLRDGKEHSTQLTIGDRSKVIVEEEEQEASPGGEDETGRVKLGLSVQTLNPQQTRDFDLKPDQGVIVTSVQTGGVADDAGIQRNDVILEVNRHPVRTPQDLRDITAKLKSGSDVVFLVQRIDRSTGKAAPYYLAAEIP
jgi:serine protease Do